MRGCAPRSVIWSSPAIIGVPERASRCSTSRARSNARSQACATCRLPQMADPRSFELDELVNRPGTYFNPQTEVVVIVDDSPDLDSEIFNMEQYEGADWVLISDETPVDENRRDEILERFQVHLHAGSAESDDPDEEPEEDELE